MYNQFPPPPPPPPAVSGFHSQSDPRGAGFHPPLPPMPGHPPGFPPFPFQGAPDPQHMQPGSIPPGPKQPVIFEGHLKNNNTKQLELLQEIQFAHSFKFEGIHIVPNQITPPGFSLVGRTKPDLMTRPFQLQIHGRVAASNELLLLLSLTIQGGVQWMPISFPFCTYDLDYLAFSGDYEEITIILHGYPNLPMDANYDFTKHPFPLPPYPFYFDDLIIDHEDYQEVRRYFPVSKQHTTAFEALKQFEKQSRGPKSLKEILALPLSSDIPIHYFKSKVSTTRAQSRLPVTVLAELVEKIFSLPTGLTLESREDYHELHQQVKSVTSIFSKLHQRSLHSNTSHTEAIDKTSHQVDTIESVLGADAVNVLVSFLLELIKFLQPSMHSFLLTNGNFLKVDDSLPTLYQDFVETVFTLLQTSLENEFIAQEFIDCNGVEALVAFLYQPYRLPNRLFESYLLVLLTLSAYPAVLNQFLNEKLLYSPDSESLDLPTDALNDIYISPNYQQLVHILSEQTADSTITKLLSFWMNFITCIDYFRQFSTAMSDLLLDLEKISEAINWKHASCENFGSSGAGATSKSDNNHTGHSYLNEDSEYASSSVMEDNNESTIFSTESEYDRNLLHLPSQALMEIYLEISKVITRCVQQFQTLEKSRQELLRHYQQKQEVGKEELPDDDGFVSFQSVHSSTRTKSASMSIPFLCDDSYLFYWLGYLQKLSFYPSLIVLNSLRLLSRELAMMIDWNAPFYVELLELPASLNQLMSSLLSILSSFKHWEVLLLSTSGNPYIQQMMDQMIAANYYSYHNPQALARVAHSVNQYFYRQQNQLSTMDDDNITVTSSQRERIYTDNIEHPANGNVIILSPSRKESSFKHDQFIQTNIIASWLFCLLSQHIYTFFQSWQQCYLEIQRQVLVPLESSLTRAIDMNEFSLTLLEENILFLYEYLIDTSEESSYSEMGLNYCITTIFLQYFYLDLLQTIQTLTDNYESSSVEIEEGKKKAQFPATVIMLYDRVLLVCVRTLFNAMNCHLLADLSCNQRSKLSSILERLLLYKQASLEPDRPLQSNVMEEGNNRLGDISLSFSLELIRMLTSLLSYLRHAEEISTTSDLLKIVKTDSESFRLLAFLTMSNTDFRIAELQEKYRQDQLVAALSSDCNSTSANLEALYDCLEDSTNDLFIGFLFLDQTFFHVLNSVSELTTAQRPTQTFSDQRRKGVLPASWTDLFETYSVIFTSFESILKKFTCDHITTINTIGELEHLLQRLLQIIESKMVVLNHLLSSSFVATSSTSFLPLLFKILLCVLFGHPLLHNSIIPLQTSRSVQDMVRLLQQLVAQLFRVVCPMYDSIIITARDTRSPSIQCEDHTVQEIGDECKRAINYPFVWTLLYYRVIVTSYDEKEDALELINLFRNQILSKYFTSSQFFGFCSLEGWNYITYLKECHVQQNELVNYHQENSLREALIGSALDGISVKKSNEDLFNDVLIYCLSATSQRMHQLFQRFIHDLFLDEWMISQTSQGISTTDAPGTRGFNSLSQTVRFLMETIRHCEERAIQIKKSNTSLKEENPTSPTTVALCFEESMFLRVLLMIQSLLRQSIANTILFLREGELLPLLFRLLQAPDGFDGTFLALQIIHQIYVSLDRWHHVYHANQYIIQKDVSQVLKQHHFNILFDSSERTAHEDVSILSQYFLHWQQDITHFLQYISIECIDFLPSLLKNYREATGLFPLLMNQSFALLYLITHHNYYYWIKFLSNLLLIGEGFTIEFLCIKCWIQFEEAYQYLYEMMDVKKQFYLFSTSTAMLPGSEVENTNSTIANASSFQEGDLHLLLLEAFEQTATATFILKMILELVMFAYESNKLTLTALSKCMRMSLCDPRKVIIRYQRMFSLWMTTLNLDFLTSISSSLFELFHARQITITLYLKHLVEITAKYSKYSLAKEEKKSLLSMKEWMIPEQVWVQMKSYGAVLQRNPFTIDLLEKEQLGRVESEEKKQSISLQFKLFDQIFYQILKKLDSPFVPTSTTAGAEGKKLIQQFSHPVSQQERLINYDLRNTLFYSLNNQSTVTSTSSGNSATSLGNNSRYHKKNRSYLTYKEYYQHIYQQLYGVLSLTTTTIPSNSSQYVGSEVMESNPYKRRKQFLALHILPKEDNEDYWTFQQQLRIKKANRGLQGHVHDIAEEVQVETEEGDKGEAVEGEESTDVGEGGLHAMEMSEEAPSMFSPMQNLPPSQTFAFPSDYDKQFQDLLRKVEEDDNPGISSAEAGMMPTSNPPQRKSRFGPSTNPLDLGALPGSVPPNFLPHDSGGAVAGSLPYQAQYPPPFPAMSHNGHSEGSYPPNYGNTLNGEESNFDNNYRGVPRRGGGMGGRGRDGGGYRGGRNASFRGGNDGTGSSRGRGRGRSNHNFHN